MRCAVCGASAAAAPLLWRCPASVDGGRHVLGLDGAESGPVVTEESANPFLRFRRSLAVDGLAESLGIADGRRRDIVAAADARVAAVAGTGFLETPFARADALSEALGFSGAGGVWVKDETGNVGRSHKARHLFTILLHLLIAEEAGATPWSGVGSRPPLAIASCGNAAVAASLLARSQDWAIRVFVPPSASPEVLDILHGAGADVVVCPRRDADPPGDPCIHRFREAVADGAVPFSVQGTENVWCLDGGRTLGWEMTTSPQWPGISRVYVQVGGGAFASCVGVALVADGARAALHPVQASGCAPLARAWDAASRAGALGDPGPRWGEFMHPWHAPASLADGILDDETYDWVSVVRATHATGGRPVVADESVVEAAWRTAEAATRIHASPTGTAGLAGLMADRAEVSDDDKVAVIFSGVLGPRPGP